MKTVIAGGRILTPFWLLAFSLVGQHGPSQLWAQDQLAKTRHWAYQPPRFTPPPRISGRDWPKDWPKTFVDHYILAALQKRGLSPQKSAGKEKLLRRVSLDLTGLPPTLQERDAFLEDRSPAAYEKAVDRLLASPRFGERMALLWLDLARYADTHGYHADSRRDMWRWRDWVIDAFNHNMPFDRFTIEQLAGDLLPAPTPFQRLSQQIASGFNRNHMINFENGAIDEEYRVEYAIDRTVTTAAVWMGQTFLCARCHDHKYDPLSQRDFYRFFAFFNNVADKGIDGRQGNAEPFIVAPTGLQQMKIAALEKRQTALQEALAAREKAASASQAAWERQVAGGGAQLPQPPADPIAHFLLDEEEGEIAQNTARQSQVTRAQIKRAMIHGNPNWFPGKFQGCMLFDGETYLAWVDQTRKIEKRVEQQPAPGYSISLWVLRTTNDRMSLASRFGKGGMQFEWGLDKGKVWVEIFREQGRIVRFVCDDEVPQGQWSHLLCIWRKNDRLDVYLNGRRGELKPSPREQTPNDVDAASSVDVSIASDEEQTPRWVLGGASSAQRGSGHFRGMIDEVRIYDRLLTAKDAALLAASDPIHELAARPVSERTIKQQQKLRSYYLQHIDPQAREILRRFAQGDDELNAIRRKITTTMVMRELQPPRTTYVLDRGDYRYRGEVVTPGVPDFLPPLTEQARANRLTLARWLVDPDHPLTSRVMANRLWQMLFGQGLVRTVEDFGLRGEPPTHPQLLDALAVEFVEAGWDIKRLLRLLVTSETYRQSSAADAEKRRKDPNNQWLSRGGRRPLEAEFVRDGALFAGGILHQRLGGGSVFPYQPAGLWKEVSYSPIDYEAQAYAQSLGVGLYRRGLYSFWKRSVPPPSMEAFGAPSREVCTLRRRPSNTPFRALVLMNDPAMIEAAQGLAKRVLADNLKIKSDPTRHGVTASDRLQLAFRIALSRKPDSQETTILLRLLEKQLADFRRDVSAARKLMSDNQTNRRQADRDGEQLLHDSPSRELSLGNDDSESRPTVELAAWTTVCNVILSLDERITKE